QSWAMSTASLVASAHPAKHCREGHSGTRARSEASSQELRGSIHMPRLVRSRAAALIAGGAIAIAFWRAAEYRLGLLERLIPHVNFYFRTDLRLDGLLWGCVMALVVSDPVWNARLSRWFGVGRSAVWFMLFLIFVVCVTYPLPMAPLWRAM